MPFCTAGSIRMTLAVDDAVAGVDGGRLAHRHVLGLGLGNAEHRLEASGLDDPGELGPRLRPLPDLERQLLQGAVGPGLHDHGAHPAPLELG